ncbi:hypothetical protein HMPREF3191_00690 [Veillonellaceae bacterium DNF00626]|nr:hypothetical protein HMPREF3191_00690 [Veillonellaceae bacterium DNF00626]
MGKNIYFVRLYVCHSLKIFIFDIFLHLITLLQQKPYASFP